ncbi:MAG: hypothetical protein LBF24_00690 [Puniceicoccales bacterium]|nr:hypothetical protein [Puniceicoccales bacterium]
MTKPQKSIEEVLKTTKAIVGVGPRVEKFLSTRYGLGGDCVDKFKLAADFWDAQSHAGVSARDLIRADSDSSCVNEEELDRCIFRLIAAADFATNLKKQRLFVRLQKFHSNEDGLRSQLEQMRGGAVPQVIVDLGITCDKSIETSELRRLALEVVVINEIRQESGVEACFAVAPLVYLQLNHPVKLMALFVEIMSSGGMKVKNRAGLDIQAPCNPYGETRGKSSPSRAVVMQRAIMRTAADASTLIPGHKTQQPAPAIDYENAMKDISKRMRAAGIMSREIICEAPRFDTNVSCKGKVENGPKVKRGTWVPHVTLEGHPTPKSLDYLSALSLLAKMATTHEKELQRKLQNSRKGVESGSTSETKQIEDLISETQALSAKIDSMVSSFAPRRGGVDIHVLEALGIRCTSTPLGSFSFAEESFLHFFNVLATAKGETKRIIAHGAGHGFTIAPEFSPILMEAIATAKADPAQLSAQADRLIAEIKSGKKIMFLDPQWEGYNGVYAGTSGNPPTVHFFLESSCGKAVLCSSENERDGYLFKDIEILVEEV